MEKNNQVEHHHHHNGVMRLPPGFRFHPTDEELVVHYLIRKALSCPLPASLIPEIDLAKYNNPWDLPGSMMQDKYFFAQREAKYQNGNRANRATGSGYWKATGKDRAIVASRCNQVVGMKKVLVFYRGKPPNLSRTSWIMYEYRLALAPQRITSPQRDWVVCHIFTKKRRNDVEQEQQQQQQQQRPSGSESSCVTEGMDESNNGEDISSSSSSSSPPP